MSEVKDAIDIVKNKLANADKRNASFQGFNIAEMEAIWGVLAKAETDAAALQQKLDALAAENARMKSSLMFWDWEDPEAPNDSPEEIASYCSIPVGEEFKVQVASRMPDRTYRVVAVDEDEEDWALELVSGAIPETPATDAWLNSVRAEGAELCVKALVSSEDEDFTDAPNVCAMVAYQLRAGEAK